MSRYGVSNDCIVTLKTATNPRVRLLCFPHGGGNAATFNAWPKMLPKDVEVCALQLPGRGPRLIEAPLTSIDEIIEEIWKAFHSLKDKPIALFGHSLGAWIAFEFARQLQLSKIPVLHLFVSGQAAPQLPDDAPPVRHLPDQEFISELRHRYNGLPEEIVRDHEMMSLILPSLRADFTIKETYKYTNGPMLECPISCLGGREDSAVDLEQLAAWQVRTPGRFNLKMFPGGHFFIDTAQELVLKLIATELQCSLRKRGL